MSDDWEDLMNKLPLTVPRAKLRAQVLSAVSEELKKAPQTNRFGWALAGVAALLMVGVGINFWGMNSVAQRVESAQEGDAAVAQQPSTTTEPTPADVPPRREMLPVTAYDFFESERNTKPRPKPPIPFKARQVPKRAESRDETPR